MPKSVIFIIAIVSGWVAVEAQTPQGGFIEINGGVAAHFSPSIQRDLQSNNILGSDLGMIKPALITGVTAFFIRPSRVVVGGTLMMYRMGASTNRGEVQFKSSAALLHLGLLLTANDRAISFPYIGIGMNGMRLKIKNESDGQSFKMRSNIIEAGDQIVFSAPGLSLEGGYNVSFTPFAAQRKTEGLIVNVKVGGLIFAGVRDWRQTETNEYLPSLAQALNFSPFLRVGIGYGKLSPGVNNKYGRKIRP